MAWHVNSVITSVETNSTSENNKLLASFAYLVAEMLGVKTRPRSGKSGKEPYWKRRIEKWKRTVLEKTDRKVEKNRTGKDG